MENQLSISWWKMRSVSSPSLLSSFAASSSWSSTFVVSVGCSSVVALATVVVLMRGRGRYCLSMSAVYEVAFRGVSFGAILCRGEPNRCDFVSSVFTDLFARITNELRLLSTESQQFSKMLKDSQTTHVAKISFAHLDEHEVKISSGLSLFAAIHHTRTSSVMYSGPPAAFFGLFSKYPRSINWRHNRYLPQGNPLVASSANSGLLQECVDVVLPWWVFLAFCVVDIATGDKP